jgi:lysophospholipase L1-like esterase
MQLDLKQIESITSGALQITEGADGIEFFRFTPAQRQLLAQKDEGFGYKCLASSGMRMDFKTNSQHLNIKMRVKNVRARSFFALEVFSNGKRVGCIDNFSNLEYPQVYSQFEFPVGEFAGSFDLGEGEKTVTVYLPWNKRTFLQSLCLDDGAYIEPVRRSKKLLAFGDSITMGYDAMYPSNRYAGRLADFLEAEEFNKAIGGERFCPDLLEILEDISPDYILVAYGTNDWSGTPWADFNARMTAFFEILNKKFPRVKTFVISPIWRRYYLKEKEGYSSFFDVEKSIEKAIADKENIFLIPGFDLVPHDETYFADGVLHPNDAGFDYYFENLKAQIQKYL